MLLVASNKIPTREHSTMYPFLLDIMAEVGTTTSSEVKTKIDRSIKILSNTFTNYDHHINIAAKFQTVTLVTTIDTLNCI